MQIFLQDALFIDPYAKALSGRDGLEMSDRLGEAASQFGFESWPEFHKVRVVSNGGSLTQHHQNFAI